MTNLVNDLLMLTDQEIQYESLSDEMLEQLSIESDPYIANAALTELWGRGSAIATEAAEELLARLNNDTLLQSTALRVVFAADRKKALDYMLIKGQHAHPQLLNALVEMLIYESDFRYEMQLASLIKRQIAGREEEMGDYLDPNSFADFAQLMK